MKPSCESDVEEDLDTYLKGLRERANKSIQKLKCTLEGKLQEESSEPPPVDGPDNVQGNSVHLSEEGESRSEMAWQELQHSHAVNELRALLRQQEIRERTCSTSTARMCHMRPRKDSDHSPSVQDLVPILNGQSEYIQHLEAEVKLFKEEFARVKQRVQVVVVENEKLREDLKSRTTCDAVNEPSVPSFSQHSKAACPVDQSPTRTLKVHEISSPAKQQNRPWLTLQQQECSAIAEEVKKWQLEVENLETLYQGKTATLELQVSLLRKDLLESQKQCQEFIERLKHQESLLAAGNADRVGGLCLKCAQHEAVMARTHSDVHMQSIDALRNERDELMSMLSNMRSNLTEMQARENSAYQQVKQSTEIAEEANLEKIQAVVHCEQLKSELLRQKEGLERELACQQEKIANAKKAVQEEMRKEREELASKVSCLSENVACLEGQLQRLMREKDSACSQLEATQKQLKYTEMEMNKESGELRYQLNQVKMKKEEAEKEFREHRAKTSRELELQRQEQHKLELEINETKCHLEHVQQDAAKTKDECLKLIELLSKAEHQLHLTRMEKDSLLHSHSDDVKALAFQSKHREQELTEKIQQMEAQHDKTVNELEALLSSQSTLTNKLKAECHTLSQKLQKITEKNRAEVGQLCQEKEYLQDRLEKLQARNDEMENQCIQHGTMHERMKQSLLFCRNTREPTDIQLDVSLQQQEHFYFFKVLYIFLI
ncbi:serologically defined colon cancer antigen 8 homolog isoform X2 [Pristis pectinata]|uniref:serologically defined colon cancer antigen 8 homolog isoform X2 n=1 Tax=Pristis pectinata TaxID=685728 RepID=UPI00223CE0C1|nr:serologically defined colon cancer antigen 8 homolog isoform X2 [Pristis pectinata]